MKNSRSRLDDQTCLRNLHASLARERQRQAEMLAILTEMDRRQLHIAQGYASVYDYCVNELGMEEDLALDLTRIMGVARRFPSIFPAIADGRLNPAGIRLLAPMLTDDAGEALLAAAAHKTEMEIRELLLRTPELERPHRG